MLISYPISKVTLKFDIEGHVMHIKFDIGYDIALSQYHSLQSRSSLCPGSITLAQKSFTGSATCPGILRLLNPAPAFCAIPQLSSQRFDEERSFHSATSFTC